MVLKRKRQPSCSANLILFVMLIYSYKRIEGKYSLLRKGDGQSFADENGYMISLNISKLSQSQL